MTSSYQILARYDEMSYCGRARCTSDIRQRHREDLQNLRLETKLAQRLKIRHLLSSDSHLDDYGYDHSDTIQDYYTCSDHCNPTNWFSDSSCNQWITSSNTPPSPSLYSESDCSFNSVCGSPSPSSPRDRQRSYRTRRESLKNRKRVARQLLDAGTIRRDYNTFKSLIATSESNPEFITVIVSARWTTIANAINTGDGELTHDALCLLTDLVSRRLLKIGDVLYIFQQGLIITLKDSLSRIGNHQIDIINFISSILLLEPQATPYIVELMSNTGFLDMFGEVISMGTSDEIKTVIKFYTDIFKILCDLSSNHNYAPTVPDNIAAMNSPHRLTEVYDPRITLKRIVQPSLMEPLANWLFKQIGFIECDFLRSSLILLADCLGYVIFYSRTICEEKDWVRSMVNLLQNINPELLIERSVESGAIDQYPATVRTELEQFQDFYKQWNSSLACYLLNP